ncbi:retron St85 family effector protein [Terasakiella pusilla]|uniref:retron St85 family effector protein n=1 Tax=Terasakiella pusilla TaxID=64973 RepID=UPI003AA9DEF3
MHHPLIGDGQLALRKRVISLFQNGFSIKRASNIVFVCGGNEATDMRPLFCAYCDQHMTDFEIFMPEGAMENVMAGGADEPFDIADFEELVGELSHAIVIFPEAPGSFAETGYFAAIEALAQKTILALDFNRQRHDSFISLGPAKKINSVSWFQPTIQLDYSNPRFEDIVERIRRVRRHHNSKTLQLKAFSEMTAYELSAVIHEIVRVMSIATVDDVMYLMRGFFNAHVSLGKVQKLMSILVGAKSLIEIGDYGHVYANPQKETLLTTREGFQGVWSEIRLSLGELYLGAEVDFQKLVEEVHDAD